MTCFKMHKHLKQKTMKTLKYLTVILIVLFTLTNCEDDYKPQLIEQEGWAEMQDPNIKTNYFISGYDDAKVDIILIHGLATNHLSWLNQVEYFKTKARVININLPYVGTGYDYNSEHNWTFELLADAVYSVMKKVKSRNAVVIGHSSGYAVGKELAIKYPSAVSKLINVDFLPFTWPPEGDPARQEFIKWREAFFLPAILSGILQEFFIESQCPTGITPLNIREYTLNCMQSMPKQLAYELFCQLTCEELWLPKPFGIPVLCIHIAENLVGFNNLVNIHPNISFEVVPYPSGHFIQMEHPKLTNQIIEKFVFNTNTQDYTLWPKKFDDRLPTE
jgi:pimeloyl-ACP methyl ester carboxylesterase